MPRGIRREAKSPLHRTTRVSHFPTDRHRPNGASCTRTTHRFHLHGAAHNGGRFALTLPLLFRRRRRHRRLDKHILRGPSKLLRGDDFGHQVDGRLFGFRRCDVFRDKTRRGYDPLVFFLLIQHYDTKSEQNDKACGYAEDPAPRDMHDARNLLVDERNEISARNKKLALVFSDDSVSRKTGSGVAARRPYQCRQLFAINRIDEPAALDKTPRGGARVPELIDALPFKQFA